MSADPFEQAVELYVRASQQQVRVLHQPSRVDSEYDEQTGRWLLADANGLLAVVNVNEGAVLLPGVEDADETVDWRAP